jgi:hypothetical protein
LTPAAPAWGDVEDFLRADGWRQVEKGERGGGRSRHVFYEKTLDDGRVLQSHISHSRQKTLSPGRFSSVLRHQLEVSREQFWKCIRMQRPVDRPIELEAGPVEHEAWVVAVLVGELHMTAEQIAVLSEEEAQRLVHEHWSRPT